MQRLRKIRSISADFKYSADHSPLLGPRLYSTTGGSPIGSELLSTKDVNLKKIGVGDSKYVVISDPLPLGHVPWRMRNTVFGFNMG